MEDQKQHPLKDEDSRDGALGNVLITGVMVVSLLSMFGVVMTGRMVIDANISSRNVVAARALYAAEAAMELALRRAVVNPPVSDATVNTVIVPGVATTQFFDNTTMYYPNATTNVNIWMITCTATIGNATRQIQQSRRRGAWGGFPTWSFVFYREMAANEDF